MANSPRQQPNPYQGSGRKVPTVHYGNILLMEFIACLLLTVLTPWAKQREADGLSPYGGSEMVKLASIILLFFILAAIGTAGSGAGRLAAWLGGLVLITDGLYEASKLAKDIDLFTGVLSNESTGQDSGQQAAGGSPQPLPINQMPVGNLFPVVGPGGSQ